METARKIRSAKGSATQPIRYFINLAFDRYLANLSNATFIIGVIEGFTIISPYYIASITIQVLSQKTNIASIEVHY